MFDTRNVMYNGREWRTRIIFDNGTTKFDETTICSWEITCEQDTSKIIGATQGKQLEVVLLADVGTNLNGTFKLEVGEYYYDKVEEKYKTYWFNMGQYWKVESVEQRDSQTVCLTAFDPMVYVFGEDKYREGGNSTEITTTELKAHIEQKYGIMIDATIPEFTIMNPYLETYRDCISYLAMISSSNAFFKNDSMTIKFVPLVPKATPDLAIDGEFYYNISFDRSEFKVKKIELDMGTGFGYSRGEGTADETVTLQMPYATQLITDEIYNNLNGYTQEGISCKFLAHPALESFDTLKLTDVYGNVHLTEINGYKLSFSGGLSMELNTQIMSANNTTTNYVENTLRTKIQIEADKILSIVEAEYQKKEATLTVSASKENIVVVLDEDNTPSKTTEFSITFTVFKNKTNEEIPCVIKNITLSDDNLTAEYSNTSPVLTLNANTDRVFTSEEGYIDCIIETTEGDVYKRLFWSTTINTIENSLIVLSATTQMFTRENALAEWTPSSITVTANCSLCELTGWKYSIDNGTSFIDAVSGSNGLTIGSNTITIANDSDLFNDTKNVIIKAITDSGVSDSITISQTGDTDMIYVLLSNENHTFVASSDGKAIPTSIDIEVMGYKGNDEAPVTIGSISNIPTGMSVSISGNIITISVDNTFTKLNGTLTIPITCEGISFKKTFSYSLSVSGGRGVSTVDNYYLASSLKKGVTVDTEGWSLEVPELTLELPYLWNYEVTTFTDNSTTTTEPALIGTYSEDGKGIDSIVEYYLISAKKTGITTSSSGWSTTIPTLTAENKYLWNYEEIVYTDGTSDTTDPVVIGVYGDKGENASWVKIETTSQVFKLIGTSYSPSTITLSPTFNNSTYSKWQYSTNNGSTWTNVTSGSNGLTISSNKLIIANTCSLFTDSINVLQFKVTGTNNAVDIMSIMRIQDGVDAFSVILNNEAHIFTGNYEGYAMAQEITLGLLGYVGDDSCNLTVGTITGQPTGLTTTINNNNTTAPSIKITVSANVMNTRSGVLNIPVSTTYNGKSYSCNKKFSYSLSLDGTPASSCKINASSNVFMSGDGGTTYSPSTLTFTGSFVECSFSKWQYLDTVVGAWKNVSSGSNGFTLSGNNLILAVTSSLFNEKGGTVSIRLLSDKSNVYDTITVSKLTQIDDISKDLENIRSEITQTNYNWKASFSTANATNMLFDGDFDKPINKCNWAILNSNSTMEYSTVNAYPFYENHVSLATRFKYNTECGIQYSLDLELKANTDYVYQAYIYVDDDSLISSSENMPLSYWTWTGDNPSNMNSTTSDIIDYSQILYSGRYNLVYVHFKTKDLEEAIKCRLFIKGKTNKSGNVQVLYTREVCFRERDTVAPYCGNSNEVIAGVTTIDMNGITVEHSKKDTKTEMSADGFFIINSEGERIAELSADEQWSILKADAVYAQNIENIYMGVTNIYVDHAYVGDSDGSQSKPWSSFSDLNNSLKGHIINTPITINLATTGDIPERLVLSELKGDGQININLNASCIFQGGGTTESGIRLVNLNVPRIIIRGASKFNQFVHGIYCTNVKYVDLQDSIYLCSKDGYGAVFDNSNGKLHLCDFTNSYTAVCARGDSRVYVQSISGNGGENNQGHCFKVMNGGIITYGATSATSIPQGSALNEGGIIKKGDNTGTTTPTSSWNYPNTTTTTIATVPSTMTYTGNFNATSKRSYSYSNNSWSDSDCKQGSWGYGLRGGHMFFDMTSIRNFLSGTVEDGNTITITRANSGGLRSGVKIYVNGSSCSSPSGTPSYGDQTLLGTLAWGETKTFTLPKAIAQGLKNGTYNSIAFYVNSNASDCYANIVSCNITLKVNK